MVFTEEAEDRLRSSLAGLYRIQRRIGQGGMATVYLAQDLKHDRQVAVKVLDPHFSQTLGAQRFVQEIQTAANLNHPHILPLFDSGEADGFLFYVMPYVAEESLRERMDREGQLSVEAALALAQQIAGALQYAHDQGVVHRDIKPENILLSQNHAVVADFGIMLAVRAAGGARLTATGVSVGTPQYMSPEQAAGDRELDPRSDLFSLAAVTYEMLVGEPPHTGPTVEVVLAKLMTADPVPPRTVRRGIPEEVNRAILKALAKQPADRFNSAKAFSEALGGQTGERDEGKSIVVLPFENLSPDPDNAFFADGLTEEVIADLSKIKALRVISRTSAMMYKDAKKSAPAIASELKVRYVLEGSVRRAGRNLRITAQLIDGASDMHLWAEKYSGTVEDAFDLQEQLSRRIVEALKGAITPEEESRLASRATDDPRVLDVWLRARHLAYSFTGPGIDEAIRLAEYGLKAIGDHALLHAALGVFLYLRYDFGFRSDEETLDRCTAEATRALEMNPDLPQAWQAKGLSEYKRGNTPETVRHLRKVLELERTGDALWWLAFLLSEAGLTTEARQHAEEALERDPLTWMTGITMGTVELFSGAFDEAVRVLEEGSRRGMVDPAFSQWWLGQALAYAGAESEAVAAFERGAEVSDNLIAEFSELGARTFRGDLESARSWFESNTNIQQAVLRDETFPRFVAMCFARLGDFDDALRWLDQASDWGFTNHQFLARHDRFLVPLRQDPRFIAFLERAREKQRAFEA